MKKILIALSLILVLLLPSTIKAEETTTTEKKSSHVGRDLAVAAGVAALVTGIVILILRGQLKTEGKNYSASSYIKPDSFKITRSGDVYLYTTEERRELPKNDKR